MAAVKIFRDPLCGDAARDVPRDQWPLLLKERRHFCRNVMPYDCRLLLFFIEDAATVDWLGYGSREEYLREGLGMQPEMVDLALQGLRLSDPSKALGIDQAVVLGQHVRGVPGGVPGPGRGHKTPDNISRFQHGTSRDYTLARLDRDGHTELAGKVRSGELSANAAAIEAGFRAKTFTVPDDVGEAVAALVRRYGLVAVRNAVERWSEP